MIRKKGEAKFVARDERDWQPAPAPETSSLTALRNAAKTCTAFHLYKRATQTVFGEGPKGAKLMLWASSQAIRKISRASRLLGLRGRFSIVPSKRRG